MPASRNTAEMLRVVDWVKILTSDMKGLNREELTLKAERYEHALQLYLADGRASELTALLDAERLDAERRLANPADAMAAEFGQEAVDIQNRGIEIEIEEIDGLLDILR